MSSKSSTPRRSQRLQKVSPPASPAMSNLASNASPASNKMTTRNPPYLPTTLENILLAIYPATLILGSLFSLLDPTARAAPYNHTTQSHFASTAPSYFAKKSNLFNQFFVKQGWAWVSISYILFLFSHPSAGPRWAPLVVTHRRLRGTIRHFLVTAWWFFVTQWFFGPPIIDRGFRLTGGQCELAAQANAGNVDMDSSRQFLTSVACKTVGGEWRGGHDISGHVFLLVLGSMFLFEEVLHVVLKFSWLKEQRTIYMADGAVKGVEMEGDRKSDLEAELAGQWTVGAKFAMAVSALSLYMLLMTAAYFHTWFEKLTGLLVALSGIYVVYFLPRFVPALRNIVGMPGV